MTRFVLRSSRGRVAPLAVFVLAILVGPAPSVAGLVVTVLDNTPVPELIEGDTLDISFNVKNDGANTVLFEGKSVDRGRFIAGDPEDRLDTRNASIGNVTTPATIAAGETRKYTFRFQAAETVNEDGRSGTYLYSIIISGKDALTDRLVVSDPAIFGATVVDKAASTPEPSTLASLGAGAVALIAFAKRNAKNTRK